MWLQVPYKRKGESEGTENVRTVAEWGEMLPRTLKIEEGAQDKARRWHLDTGKGTGGDSPLKPPEGMWSC